MASADQVLLTGCSSGGLAVILHCDQLRAFYPPAAGDRQTTVKCLSDGGLYLDAYVWFNLPSVIKWRFDRFRIAAAWTSPEAAA